jgi:ABC-type antimicrobial peptide transport system permease subunit
MPFGGRADRNAVTVVGHTPKPGESLHAHHMSGVTGDYFVALGIPLREGRLLTADDSVRDTKVCVIDEDVARYYWPNGGALGGEIYQGVPKPDEKPYTIVGVLGAIKQSDLAENQANGAIYLPYAQYASGDVGIIVRSAQEPASAAAAVRSAVLRVDADLAVFDLQPLQQRITASLDARRSPMVLAIVFSGLALVLVTVGLYGVLAYAVSQRRREIGVRMALGAEPLHIRTQFLGLGARLALVGAVLGAIGAWCSGRAMNGLLFGVNERQPGVYLGTALALAAVALLACLLPAMRAARVPPMEALRGE